MDYLQYLEKVDAKLLLLYKVLNLVINGLPSIPKIQVSYKQVLIALVLNLVINGLPSIQKFEKLLNLANAEVLNLVINGLPSILANKYKKEVF